ncbi:MAG: hypothetical protein M0Z41_08070 [Peptococcaceae bacterium]|nr:hypothetical protein [Peptococcaceae bacterium]
MAKTDPMVDGARPRICILEDGKLCDDCCECYVCDLDPDKICDSCGKCLETADYSGIIVDGIIMDGVRARSPGKMPDRAGRKSGINRGARRFRLVRKES